MADRTKINTLIRLITLATGLVIGGGVSASVVEVNARTLPVIGHAPVVSGVQFDKMTPAVNDKVSATPTITDADNDTPKTSLYQWKLDGADIPGATQNSYSLVPGDGNGKQLTVVVTPQTNPTITEPATGAMFTSSALTTQGLAPEAIDVKIDGKPEAGHLLTGNYRYHDGDSPSDRENTSASSGTSFQWVCSRGKNEQTLATTKTYNIKEADVGCNVSFRVIPRALSGTPSTGTQVRSNNVIVTRIMPLSPIQIFNGNQIGDRSGYGYNMVIDYANLGYGALHSIRVEEHRKRSGSLVNIRDFSKGDNTNTSIVTDDGSSIKFGANASESVGVTVYFEVIAYFLNGKVAKGTSPDLLLSR
ncbi:hypothetical protein J8Z86_04095 [Yersinia enterocolitica]|uniref:hypothetical protein n=1 Tax=Yersinia enterocolitica TaxID=630 RepID=UPI001C8EFCA3|nr:hypothetical protein [Yersinia enterocolitica]MBX9495264.1 hypothetical protein [Yersinia enterocolitica]